MTTEILLNGVTLSHLLEKIGQLIEKKVSDLHPPKNTQAQSELITRKETAKILKVSLPTLHEWTKLGWLQSYKIGTKVFYKMNEIETALLKVGSLKFKKGGTYYAQ